jgi:hypothetical protein
LSYCFKSILVKPAINIDLRNSAKYQNEAYYYLAINAERKQHYETAKAYYRLVATRYCSALSYCFKSILVKPAINKASSALGLVSIISK